MKEQVFKWNDIAQVPQSREMVDLYAALIEEEFLEFKEAYTDNNYADMVDACIDLLVVIYGELRAMQVDVERAEEEVMESNFSKFARIRATAVAGKQFYYRKGVEAYIDEVKYKGDIFYILRRSLDNKILKPAVYTEPDWSWLTPPKYF